MKTERVGNCADRTSQSQHCTECDGNGYHTDDCPNAHATGCTCQQCRDAIQAAAKESGF